MHLAMSEENQLQEGRPKTIAGQGITVRERFAAKIYKKGKMGRRRFQIGQEKGEE